MDTVLSVIGIIVVAILVGAAVMLFSSLITLWAWNILMPAVFHLPTINFFQAIAFNMLASCFRTFDLGLNKKK